MLSQTPSHRAGLPATSFEAVHEKDNASSPRDEALVTAPNPDVQKISNLRLSSSSAPVAIVRGVVTLTSPSVFIQDSSAGLELSGVTNEFLNVGDEIEATGPGASGRF